MILKVLGVWLLIDGLGSILAHRADGKKYKPRLRIVETITRIVRSTIGAALVVVG